MTTLNTIIIRARDQRMWLHCNYQDLWFSPNELEAENKQGRFRWGPTNWELRDPQERIQQLEHKIELAKQNLTVFKERLC